MTDHLTSNQRLYARKKRPRIATHITQELIEAHILDDAPLPDGLRVGGCSYHKKDRKVWSVQLFCATKSTAGLPVAIGEWLLGPDEHGHCDTVQNWVFERDWEPCSAAETSEPYLHDRASGVQGVYCIARKRDGITEYWTGNSWAAFCNDLYFDLRPAVKASGCRSDGSGDQSAGSALNGKAEDCK